jgi:lysozyme family protein
LKESYPLSIKQVLKHEGGYVNHPSDPGGATNKGITQLTYNAWRKSKGLPMRSVKLLEDAEVGAIYKQNYWDKVHGDELPVGVDYAVFDFAVNSGPARAAKFLQRLVGVAADGIIGPATVIAATAKQFGLVDKLCDERLRFLQTLPHWRVFKNGWTSRVAGVRAVAKSMRKAYAGAQSA